MTDKELIKFLVQAKKNTYASETKSNRKILTNGAKLFSFQNSNFLYQDRYFGFNPFVGEEIVLKNKKVVWVMNYSGKCLNQNYEAKNIFNFLKKCLQQVNQKTIFRGPKEFKKDNFKYLNKINGNIKYFYGEEYIYHKNKKVYELRYQGGIIQSKTYNKTLN